MYGFDMIIRFEKVLHVIISSGCCMMVGTVSLRTNYGVQYPVLGFHNPFWDLLTAKIAD